jgi:hypothetical protein
MAKKKRNQVALNKTRAELPPLASKELNRLREELSPEDFDRLDQMTDSYWIDKN